MAEYGSQRSQQPGNVNFEPIIWGLSIWQIFSFLSGNVPALQPVAVNQECSPRNGNSPLLPIFQLIPPSLSNSSGASVIYAVRKKGDRAKLLPYTNFYVEVLTQYWIKLLHVEVLTNVRIKLLHIEVLTIFPDKTSTLTKSIKITPPNSKVHINQS